MIKSRNFLVALFVVVAAACGGGGGGGADHIEITFVAGSNQGLTCEAFQVKLELHDSSHNDVEVDENETVTITTSPTVESAPSSVSVPKDSSSVTFYMYQTSALGPIDIDVSGDGGDIEEDAGEDPEVTFVDSVFRFYANNNEVSDTPIGTQISGLISTSNPSSQTLELRAIETDGNTGACTGALTGTTAVDIAYKCKDPTACAGSDLLTFSSTLVARNDNSVSDSSLSYTPVNLTFDASGIAPISLSYTDAGQVQLFARKVIAASSPDPESTLSGSSNSFVVRPFGFDIDFANARASDWGDGSLGSSSNASYSADASGTAYVKVDASVVATVTAVVWQAADDSPIDGFPDPGANLTDNNATPHFGQETSAMTVSWSHTLIEPSSGGVSGTLSATSITTGGGSSDFSSGVATSTLSWSEVGIIDITATLDNYLGDANADITGKANNVGRFYPDHFELTSTVGGYGNSCTTGTDFTYIGQAFNYASSAIPTVTVIPKNSANATVSNYIGGLKKLLTTSMSRSASLTSTNSGVDASNLVVAAVFVNNPTITDGSSGSESSTIFTFSASDAFTYTRNSNSKVASFAVGLPISVTDVTDSDGVKAEDGSNNEITTDAAYIFTPSSAGTSQRFGRIEVSNAFGPEAENLIIPMQAEYWDGASATFIVNADDSCTAYNATSVGLSSYTSNLEDGETGAVGSNLFSSGGYLAGQEIYLSAPGVGNEGGVDVSFSVSSWLTYDWSTPGTYVSPSSVAAFGRYRGHDKIIFWREVSE